MQKASTEFTTRRTHLFQRLPKPCRVSALVGPPGASRASYLDTLHAKSVSECSRLASDSGFHRGDELADRRARTKWGRRQGEGLHSSTDRRPCGWMGVPTFNRRRRSSGRRPARCTLDPDSWTGSPGGLKRVALQKTSMKSVNAAAGACLVGTLPLRRGITATTHHGWQHCPSCINKIRASESSRPCRRSFLAARIRPSGTTRGARSRCTRSTLRRDCRRSTPTGK